MDVTTIACGSTTRDRLAEYRDTQGFDNYDQALQSMLAEVGAQE
jgi:hypothetical protein